MIWGLGLSSKTVVLLAMRWLYCDRKLSLLRSRKAEPFCSEEHWDLYRSEQSAIAIARILGKRVDDAGKLDEPDQPAATAAGRPSE